MHSFYSIASFVRFEQLFEPMKKTYFLKFVIREIRKFPYENLSVFLGKLYQKFALDSKYTGDTPYQVWFDLDNSMAR